VQSKATGDFMDSLGIQAPAVSQNSSAMEAHALPSRGWFSWLRGNSHASTETTENLIAAPLEPQANSSVSLTATHCDALWKNVHIANSLTDRVNTQGPVQTVYTAIEKQIMPVSSWTIFGNTVPLLAATNEGGIVDWRNKFWFASAAADATSRGLLSVDKSLNTPSVYLPLPGLEQGSLPVFVASHSKHETICIYEMGPEGSLANGFSIWSLSRGQPVLRFRQQDLESLAFIDGGMIVGIRNGTHQLACWNVSSQKLIYSLEGWCHASGQVLIGPYQKQDRILLTWVDNVLYAFDASQGKLLYQKPFSDASFHSLQLMDNDLFVYIDSQDMHIHHITDGSLYRSMAFESFDSSTISTAENLIAILKAKDPTHAYVCEASKGEFKTFGPCAHPITEVWISADRLIAECAAASPTINDRYYIWDVHTGALINEICAPQGCSMRAKSIEGKHIIFHVGSKLEQLTAPSRKSANDHVLISSLKGSQWHDPAPFTTLGTIRMDIWNLKSGTFVGKVTQELANKQGTYRAHYKQGRLIVDADSQKVLIQDFQL
jgi:hypothetical protein